MYFNDNNLEKIYIRMQYLIDSLNVFDNDNKEGNFPRYKEVIFTRDEYDMVNGEFEKYVKYLGDIKMFYLSFCMNMKIRSDNIDVYHQLLFKENPQNEAEYELNRSILDRKQLFLRQYLYLYFGFVLNEVNFEFPFNLSMCNSKDIRYILLNVLNLNGSLGILLKSNLWNYNPNDYKTFMLKKSCTEENLYETIFLDVMEKGANKENMPMLSLYKEYFKAVLEIEDSIENKFLRELLELSYVYICNFSESYKKLTSYIDKFLSIQKLLLVSDISMRICGNSMTMYALEEYSEEILIEQAIFFMLYTFNRVCLYILQWFKNPLNYLKTGKDLPIEMVLDVYGESAKFMEIYNKFIEFSSGSAETLRNINLVKNNYKEI